MASCRIRRWYCLVFITGKICVTSPSVLQIDIYFCFSGLPFLSSNEYRAICCAGTINCGSIRILFKTEILSISSGSIKLNGFPTIDLLLVLPLTHPKYPLNLATIVKNKEPRQSHKKDHFHWQYYFVHEFERTHRFQTSRLSVL